MKYDYDYLVVGSGFGGSVCALRLAEKGWRVGVFEQGKAVDEDAVHKAKSSPLKLMWKPGLGMRGYFVQHMFPHLTIVGGVGVGGGSLVWGAVALEPNDEFYSKPELEATGVDWKYELAPHYDTARRMLGVTMNPRRTRQDDLLQQTAEKMGVASSFGNVPNSIYFGGEGFDDNDPYFAGQGPARKPCTFCSGCLTGCDRNAKNTLDKNYLHLAQNLGTEIVTDVKVKRVDPVMEGGYRVTVVDPGSGKKLGEYTCKKLILAAGVVGTLSILAENRDRFGTLLNVNQCLGDVVRTNSEAITAVLHPEGEDLSDGTAISTDFHADKYTHITQNRFDHGYRFMRFMAVPMVDGAAPLKRALKTVWVTLTSPRLMFDNWFGKSWEKRVSFFTIMQNHDNSLRLKYKRSWSTLFRRALTTEPDPDNAAPTYLPVANEATRHFAELAGGQPLNTVMESVGNIAATAHILSGCTMAQSPENAVIDANHEVHGHPGLFVVDGAAIPANLGVNPSLTITAMAERYCSLQPAKDNSKSVAGPP